MKQLFLTILIVLLFTNSASIAQGVAINNDNSNPDPSAMLDVKSTTKGLLVPRMTQAQRIAITTPANGLLIYQTDNPGGFYYYSGAGWFRLSLQNEGWSTTGNAGTDPTNNFIGTSENQPLRFRVNNTWAGELNPATGNVFWGLRAGQNNTIGYSNIALGRDALKFNTTRSNLVAIGDSALFNNGIGANSIEATGNTAVGSKALFSNTKGFWNTANGYKALYNNISGIQNTALGYQALLDNTTSSANTAVGYQALAFNINGNGNTAIGDAAMIVNTGGDYNTAMGGNAMNDNNVGNYNTAIGWEAMQANIDGNWNTCIGEYTNTSVGNLLGATSLGASAITNANNKIVIGANVAGMVIGGYANWANLSDGRFKEDIKEDVPGLAFIRRLRPVTYWVNTDKLQRHITAQMPDSIAQHYLPTAEEQANDREYTHTGFVAQEVEATAKAIGYAFDGVNAPKNPTDNYSIAYSQFVPSLVKAVQELNQKNETLENLVKTQQEVMAILNKQNEQLVQRIEKLETK